MIFNVDLSLLPLGLRLLPQGTLTLNSKGGRCVLRLIILLFRRSEMMTTLVGALRRPCAAGDMLCTTICQACLNDNNKKGLFENITLLLCRSKKAF